VFDRQLGAAAEVGGGSHFLDDPVIGREQRRRTDHELTAVQARLAHGAIVEQPDVPARAAR
jgi:hypothetical protein